MSTYRVVLDGQDIYDPTKKDLVLYNAVVKTEAGAAGSFDLTMPPGHVFYGKVTPYGSTIEVFEDGESIFYGRPLRPKIGFYNQATYHCEGALAFLNDIHGPEFIYEDIMVQNYFRNLIATHNAGEQAKQERRFTVGNITVIDNVAVYRETSPSSTIFDLIKKGCIGTSGGYLFTRRVNGVTYIDWVADMPYTCNQTVEFAVNLIDMARSGDDDIYTGVMLKGGKPDDAPEGAGAVTAGPIWMSAEIQAKYGNMCAYLEYPDIKTSAGLIEKGDEFLQKQQFESMCFEVTAAEQHYLNVSLDAFKAGQMVYLISHPHFVQMQLPVQSVEYNLNSGAKKITLGTAKKQTLTKIERRIRDNTDAIQENLEQQREDLDKIIPEVQDMIDNSGIVPGDDGNDYAIGVDPNGDVYATKVPSRIRITHPPDKTTYQQGETYDWTGLIVMAEYGDGTTEDVTSRCGIAPEDGATVTDENGNHQGTVALIVGRGGLEDYFDYAVVPGVVKKIIVHTTITASGWKDYSAYPYYEKIEATGTCDVIIEADDPFEIKILNDAYDDGANVQSRTVVGTSIQGDNLFRITATGNATINVEYNDGTVLPTKVINTSRTIDYITLIHLITPSRDGYRAKFAFLNISNVTDLYEQVMDGSDTMAALVCVSGTHKRISSKTPNYTLTVQSTVRYEY